MKKIPLSFARLLRLLLTSELNYADFNSTSNKKLLELFITDNVLEARLLGKQQRKIFCSDKVNLTQYLHNKFGISSLDQFILFLERDETERRDAVLAASDSKLRKTKVLTGFLVNCYEELPCVLNSTPFCIKPIPGAFTFISAYKTFSIPPDVTVVIVENHENFREIHRQRHLFMGIKTLFVWRYQNSNTIAAWLNSIPNNYIHFGDLDLKGIHIFLAEFKNKITGDRGKFFIPPDIQALLLKHGEKSLYDKQKAILPALRKHPDTELSPLIELITRYRKGLAQEALIL